MSQDGGILKNSVPLQPAGREEMNDFGTTSNYAKKSEILEKEAEDRIALDDILEVGTYMRKFFREDLPKISSSAYKAVKSGLTPGFIKRNDRRKIHLKYVNDKEAKLEHLHEDAEHVMEEEKKFTKLERERAKLVAEMLKYKQQVKNEEKEVIDAAKAEVMAAEFREFHKRREEQIREKEAKVSLLEKEKKEQQEKEQQDLRNWRVSFYSNQAAIYHEEATQLSPAKVQREKNEESLNRLKTEWVDREQARIRMQVELAPNQPPSNDLPPSVADKVLYGFERKAFKHEGLEAYDQGEHPSTKENDLMVEEIEDNHHDVHLFDVNNSHIAYEKKVIEQYDTQSALSQQQILFEALEGDIHEMKEAISRMMDMKEILEREQKQITEEILGIEIDQRGPPRRLAMSHEIPAMDLWKQRAAQAKKNLSDIQYAIDKAQRKRQTMVQQSLSIAKGIATLKEKERNVDKTKQEFNEGFGNLPMVVGRSITKVPGMNIMANAGEFTSAVIQKSKLVNMKTESETAISLHKESTKIDQEMWIGRFQENSARTDLESMISRISAIGEKLQRAKVDNMKLNIVDALKGFLASGIKLRNVKKKAVGIIPWFKYHDFTISVNIIRYVTSNAMGAIVFDEDDTDEDLIEEENEQKSQGIGKLASKSADSQFPLSPDAAKEKEKQRKRDYAHGVTLGNEYDGICAGSVLLPKDTLWIISVTITKQGRGSENENVFPQDSVTVEFGPTQTALQTVGVYYNRINPQTGTVLYDVKYVFRGNQLAYRFKFHSLVNETKRHLAICTGIYEEYEIQELELVSDPKNMKKTRVLSSYVKLIRMEEKKGKLRETRLLEELIDVENSQSPYWDSQTLNFTLQRYAKEYFLRILKAEILLQQQITMKQREKEKYEEEFEIISQSSSIANEKQNKTVKLQESAKRYIMKKRGAQQALINQAEDLIGKRLILWDVNESKWRNIMVNDLVINWIENGLVVQIIYKIQEYNEINEPLGKVKEIDLSKFKYFISPIQQYDEQLIQKKKEKLKWENEIASLQETSKLEQLQSEEQWKKYQRKSLKHFKVMKQQIIEKFEDNAPDQAEVTAKKSVAKKRIKEEYYPNVLLDMRKGLIEIDMKKESQGNIRQLARKLARERYIEDWIKEKREDLMKKLAEKEEEMQEAIREKQLEMQQKKQQISAHYEQEIHKIKQFLRKQYLIQKNRLVEQAKFPKEVFAKVLPISYHCEHLRTKAWGDSYAKGVRCLHCGKELSELYKEESQILGYGSGGNRELFEKYRLHYENEANYRPKDNFELMIIEKERIRLEKERREISENEQYFYDFQDLQVIYQFDRRHAREIKQFGIFRQGLQWTQDELEHYEQKKLVKEEVRLRREGLPEHLLQDYDPLAEIENPPPTFRAENERHYSQYQDLLYFIGRLHNYTKKIQDFKKTRFGLIYEKKIFSFILESLHKDSYTTEMKLIELENDLDRTSQLLYIYSKMEKLWMQANLITHQAKKQKMKIEMNQIYYPFEIKIAKDELNLVHHEMKNLLKTKIVTEKKIDALSKEVEYYESVYHKQKSVYEENYSKLLMLKICMPGNMVYTKLFGLVFIVSYRSSDDMVLVSLPFGNPPAKAYIYYKEIVEIAEKKQKHEIVLMGLEDERMQTFLRQEKILMKKETYQMAREEEQLKKIYEFFDLNKFENQLKEESIQNTVLMSYEITESKRYHDLQKKSVQTKLDAIVKDRLKRRKDFIGPRSARPKALSMYERYKQKKLIQIELKQNYIMKMAQDAEMAVTQGLLESRRAWLLNYLFTNFIDSGIKEMIYDIAYEAIDEGKEAKLSIEKKTGIFFPQPSYMSYGTYSLLSNLWQNYKNQLKEDIMLNESAVQKLIISLQNKVANTDGQPQQKQQSQGKSSANERKKWLLKNPNYNNNKKLAKLYWDVTKKASQYQANQAGLAAATAAGAGGAPGGGGGGASTGTKKGEEEEVDGHVVQKKQQSHYEKKKARKLVKRLKQLEIQRQERLCYEMFQEELLCKTFYAWELKENLRERRLMKEEEKHSLMIRKEEEKLKKAIAERMALVQKQRQQGLNADEINLDEIKLSDVNLTSDLLAKRDLSLGYEKRRKELKDLTIERRRRAEDQRLMILEDELSSQLREIDKIERQKKAYEQEFGADDEDDEEGKSTKNDQEESGKGTRPVSASNKKISKKQELDEIGALVANFMNNTDPSAMILTAAQSEAIIQSIRPNDKILSQRQLPVPDWLLPSLPRKFNDLPILEKNQYIRLRVIVNTKYKKIQKIIHREEKRLLRLEKRSYKEWEMKYRIFEQLTRKSELLMMESKEELFISTNKLTTIQENINKIQIFCREVGEKELKLKTKYSKLSEDYANGQEEYQEACDWYALCLKRNKNRDKLKRRVVANCKFIDTESINGFYQRFETHRLRERVYLSYFQTIVRSIVNRAEMIASERKLLLLQLALSENKYYLINREKGMNVVKRELKCSEYLRMRRSLLNQTFFPKNRALLLSNALKGWIRFYYWNRGNRQAYQLKFEILKRQLDIDRQFKKQLALRNQSDYNRDPSTESAPPAPTLMHRIRERPVQCKHCYNFYIASQNQSLSCAYHPDTYQLQCPETCPQPGLTALCSVHRKKRWGCCRLTDQNAIGCARRYHTPPDSDPVFDYIMNKINERDANELEELNEQIQIARQENYPEKVKVLQKSQLLSIEKGLEDAREVAARFKNLKFV